MIPSSLVVKIELLYVVVCVLFIVFNLCVEMMNDMIFTALVNILKSQPSLLHLRIVGSEVLLLDIVNKNKLFMKTADPPPYSIWRRSHV